MIGPELTLVLVVFTLVVVWWGEPGPREEERTSVRGWPVEDEDESEYRRRAD